MMAGRRPVAGEDAVCVLQTRLEALEALLEARAEAGAGRPAAPGAQTDRPADGARALAGALAALEEAVVSAPEAAQRFARRLGAVRARSALQARRVPVGALDGLYESVRAQTVDAPRADVALQRARMSRAFLDVPRSLVVWRRAAVAACALLALGVGWMTTAGPRGGGFEAAGPAVAPLAQPDARDELLRRLEPRAPVAGGSLVHPVGWNLPPERSERAPVIFTGADPDVRRFLDSIRRRPVPQTAKDRDVEQN